VKPFRVAAALAAGISSLVGSVLPAITS